MGILKHYPNLLEMKIIDKYKKVAIDMIKLSYPDASYAEIEEAVDWSIVKRCKDYNARIHNNYKKKEINISLIDLAEYIMKREPIITRFGVLFKRDAENPLADLFKKFMDTRDEYKKEMYKHEIGSEQFEKYNLFQLLSKIDANG